MSTLSVILIFGLLLWVYILQTDVKKLKKDLSDIGRWSAYLETTIKDAKVLVFNSEKGKNGEWEVNNKLVDLLK